MLALLNFVPQIYKVVIKQCQDSLSTFRATLSLRAGGLYMS